MTRRKAMAAAPVEVVDDAPPTGKALTRERLKAFVVRHYSTRMHMSAILMACGLTSMATSWSLLHLGVGSMLVRYPISLAFAYATFLIGVWVWLRATGLGPAGKPSGSSLLDGLNFSSSGKGGSWGGGSSGGGSSGGGFAGRGGSFDGGGASASFAESRVPLVGVAMPNDGDASSVVSKSGGSSWGHGLSLDIDGDGLALLVLAAVLALAVFLLSGYLIYTAPDVLSEAAFGASLAGALSTPARQQTQAGWVMGVVRKTWWPFAVVLVLAIGFAGWSAAHYPQATTFKQAIHAAVNS